MEFKNYREESRKNWGRDMEENDKLTLDQINTGCLLRIADAVEKMSGSYAALINDRDYYKRRFDEEREATRRLNRSNLAFKGVITKLKKKH